MLNFFALSQENNATNQNKNPVNELINEHYSTRQLRGDIAKAQIQLLKNGGALLVRLKTNSNAISKLKEKGNYDLATNVERETYLKNKVIVRGFINEFKFCPVYFFYSDFSDSVKYKRLENIFLDSNLLINPAILCKAPFYLIAEQGSIYDLNNEFISEANANSFSNIGNERKKVAIVIKNRFFNQLQRPFPYYQAGYSMKKYKLYVKKFNAVLENFYLKNNSFIMPDKVRQYVY